MASASAAATVLLSILFLLTMRILRSGRDLRKASNTGSTITLSDEATALNDNLVSALPNDVVFTRGNSVFEESMGSYWAKQECEIDAACVVRPRNTEQLSTAISVIEREFRRRERLINEGTHNKSQNLGIFAIRSGGHSPISGAANIAGGVLVDLRNFDEVSPSEDRSTVTIGTGAKWGQVSKVLDQQKLAIVGGRNSAVGVGGLTLGGGLSFFSPQFGLVCSNIVQYEVVLASGAIVNASATEYTNLWRALKGGSNNFGVVTRFIARSFPSADIWSGFLYLPSFQSAKVLRAFHEFVGRADPNRTDMTYDQSAAGPIACFTYLQPVEWPACWRNSSFKPLWRFWNTCKTPSLTSATDEMSALNPPGRRQVFSCTTIKNDASTLATAHAVYREAITLLRRVKGLSWTLVLQPQLPEWARKSAPNPLGLDKGTNEPLIIVSLTVNWLHAQDDKTVEAISRETIEQIDKFAMANETGHPYRYLNYCGAWQQPFDGFGEENLHFLKEVSKEYDPKGLFQKGCVGGFKLHIVDDEDQNTEA
ncbi:MAG: hypothetical protein M1820_003249 [Bogoriella megaspora]|nr:MAG: hypothetical protein M1820_003249 [Bogoriella megaspora]